MQVARRVFLLVDEMNHPSILLCRSGWYGSYGTLVRSLNSIMFASKKALLLLANGSEDCEVVITVDVSETPDSSVVHSRVLFAVEGSTPSWYQTNDQFD